MALDEEISAARKRIFRDGYDISFGELVSLYERKELIIQPEYQRLFRWDPTQKTRFIESLLLNIPIPPVFVFSDDKGRWELVDGLQRVSTVLEFMGVLRDTNGNIVPPFTCDGTGLVPSLKGAHWPTAVEEEAEARGPAEADALPDVGQPNGGADEEPIPEDILPLQHQLAIRRARIRVEILGQETDAHVKYELFQRLNSGGANLSEQELRNCIMVAIDKTAFERVRAMSANAHFNALARVGEEREKRQYKVELVVRFVVLRNFEYRNGLDVHEYLDKGIVSIFENKDFDWDAESKAFADTMQALSDAVGANAFYKNDRFSLGLFEFITLGLSTAIEGAAGEWVAEQVRARVTEAPELPEARRYSGSGVRGTQRFANFIIPHAVQHFRPRLV